MFKDKRLIILIVLIILYFICRIPISLLNKNNYTIYLGSSTKVSVDNGNISVEDDNYNIGLKKVSIYNESDSSYIDGYMYGIKGENDNDSNMITYGIYNEKDDRLFYEFPVAVDRGHEIDILALKKDYYISSQERKLVNDYLAKLNVNAEIDKIIKYNYDIDKNGVKENIFEIKTETIDNQFYTVCLLESNNKVVLLDQFFVEYYDGTNDGLKFEKLMDLDGDGKYEIIIGNNKGMDGLSVYKVFAYDGEIREIK